VELDAIFEIAVPHARHSPTSETIGGTMTPKKKGKLYAFWPYDLYPYMLGGVVTNVFEDGSILLNEYGNCTFPSVVLVAGNPGKLLLERTKKLRAMLRDDEKELHNRYIALLRDECLAQGVDPDQLKIPKIKE
jgi:hypothetical protein